MNNFIKRLLIFGAPIAFIFLGIVCYNIYLDPFGVIKGNMALQKTEPNQHYLKIRYILNNPQKYNSFLFGASRVGKIDVTKIPDSNSWYNFAYSEAIPFETLEDLKLLLRNNIQIKRILIGLDETSYMVSPEMHKKQSLRQPYKNLFSTYLYYLFLKPDYTLYRNIKYADTARFYSKGAYEIVYKTGNFPPNKKDIFIENNKDLHIRDSIFNKPYWKYYYKERIDKTINEIYEIKKICELNKIEVIFFLNPIYKETYLKAISNCYFNFVKKLSSIIQFYDFSGLNEITTNNLNYYENSHYRTFVGDKILNNIFNSKMNNVPFVNRNNVDSVITKKKNELIKHKYTTDYILHTPCEDTAKARIANRLKNK